MNKANKRALNRSQRKPLRWEQLPLPIVWLEDNGKSDVIPAFPEPVKDRGVMCFLTAKQEFITADKAEYGKRWRAWDGRPTWEERRSVKWM